MSKRFKIVALVAVVVVAAGGFGVWYQFFRDDAPPPVDLESAVDQLDDATTTTGGGTEGTEADDTTDTTAASAGGIEGTYAVDTSQGTFDFESASGTFVGFRIQEELTLGSTTAVGRTGTVSGSITIEGTTLTATDITADLSTITTNDSRRDSRAREALDTGNFPEATFTLTEPVDLGEEATSGGPVSVQATGELTISGVTQTVTFDLDAQLASGVVVVVGSADIALSDFEVEKPTAPIVLSIADTATIEFQLLLSPA